MQQQFLNLIGVQPLNLADQLGDLTWLFFNDLEQVVGNTSCQSDPFVSIGIEQFGHLFDSFRSWWIRILLLYLRQVRWADTNKFGKLAKAVTSRLAPVTKNISEVTPLLCC